MASYCSTSAAAAEALFAPSSSAVAPASAPVGSVSVTTPTPRSARDGKQKETRLAPGGMEERRHPPPLAQGDGRADHMRP